MSDHDQAADQARAHNLALALDTVLARFAAEFGLSSAAIGAALTEAAVRWSLRDMAAIAVAEYLRDVADNLERRTDQPGDDARLVN